MKVELANGQVIAYDRTGVSGVPIVLLHGLSGYRESYASTIEHLHDQIESGSFQVFEVDLRGHGESSWATLDTYDAVSYSQDIALFIETVVGRPAVVVGHSLGGVVSATLAQHRPDLVCATLLEDPPLTRVIRLDATPAQWPPSSRKWLPGYVPYRPAMRHPPITRSSFHRAKSTSNVDAKSCSIGIHRRWKPQLTGSCGRTSTP